MTPRLSHSVFCAMRRALAQLPDHDRTIFVRCRFDDDRYERIALDLGLTAEEVERGLVRAFLTIHVAANNAERRSFRVRIARICTWLRAHLPRG